MNKHVKRYDRLVRRVVAKSFPELKGEKIVIWELPKLSRYLQSFSYKGITSYHIVMFTICRSRGTVALQGQLAHELSHLVRDYYGKNFFTSMWHLTRKIVSTLCNTNFSRVIERKTDKETIKRGYGKERLALTRDWERTYSKEELTRVFYSRGYLKPNEI